MASMREIARQAQVSRTTVSYVLNNAERADGSISASTRQRVLEAAAQIGYHSNALAKAASIGRARLLAVFMGASDTENKLRILTGALTAANERGYVLKVLHISAETVTAETIAHSLEWRVSGALAVNLDVPSMELLSRKFSEQNLSLAFADSAVRQPRGARVVSDDGQGIRLVVEHLASLGHCRIALLNGDSASAISQWREASFRVKMLELGLPLRPAHIISAPWSNNALCEAAAYRLLQSDDRPTAIVCAGDGRAMLVIRVARALGINVPHQLSVTGYANSTLSDCCDPALTTVKQPFDTIGRRALELLVEAAEDPDSLLRSREYSELLPTELIVRQSTAIPGTNK